MKVLYGAQDLGDKIENGYKNTDNQVDFTTILWIHKKPEGGQQGIVPHVLSYGSWRHFWNDFNSKLWT